MKQTECVEKTHEINKINDELKHAKREITQLTKKMDLEKKKIVLIQTKNLRPKE